MLCVENTLIISPGARLSITSLLGVDLVINTLALRCWRAYESGFHVCFRLTHLSEGCTVLYATSPPS